eukprot:CAMPEP_0181076308 /NCGR_PEP_ID=MMETSP1071-20121207/350_1 /TAXON_ID=35127 /ORGANISM="Thalassiosira sp., Strain NH16" /LENGTH=550 /DNA_ID=CAMNT_0023157481 /DNA_START=243 /DNA_END=1895 /DNA_ORIENTATION=+
MRRAVADLRRGVEELRHKVAVDDSDFLPGIVRDGNKGNHRKLIHSAWIASQKYQEERDVGMQDVRKRLRTCHDCLPIDTIHVDEDGSSWNVVTSPVTEPVHRTHPEWNASHQFKTDYIARNIPCVIRGLDKSHFANISTQWRTKVRHPDDVKSDGNESQCQRQERMNHVDSENCVINTDWFRCAVGSDTLVPVRIDNASTHDIFSNGANNEHGGLDEDGRAQECETRQIKLDDWIRQCKQQSQMYIDEPTNGMQIGYLKDWHLVQYLMDKQNVHSTQNTVPSLYQVPNFLERDVLNRFLTRYCDGGDYKFTYWGPAGSQTRLHSDVLHSFSWSYNVVGKKKWVFHVPTCHEREINDAANDNEKSCFEVIQNTGEAIFVPSTWKHEVINLAETLSINHNWITSANIDQTWDCLQVEISAIEEEIEAWGVISNDDFEARENMLRGCIGLNVTMFTLMTALEIVELMQTIADVAVDEHEFDRLDGTGRLIEIFHFENILRVVMRQPDIIQRLEAILDSQLYALEVGGFVKEVMEYTSILKQCLFHFDDNHCHQ